jgi:hypothetical protein
MGVFVRTLVKATSVRVLLVSMETGVRMKVTSGAAFLLALNVFCPNEFEFFSITLK